MKCIFINLSLIFCSFHLRADDTFSNLYLLTENVRSIVLNSPDGNPFSKRQFTLSEIQTDQVASLVEIDQLTNEYMNILATKDCDKASEKKIRLLKVMNNRDVDIVFSAQVSGTRFEQNVLGKFNSSEYSDFLFRLSMNGNQKTIAINTIAKLENAYKKEFPKVNFYSLTLAEKELKLSEFAKKYLGEEIPSGVLMKELAAEKLIEDSANWKSILNEAKDKLSNQQKIELISNFGDMFGRKYNYSRRDEGAKAKGYVKIEQLLDSLKNGVDGGICRDIALAQTQMLRELGFKNNYTVTYKTLSGFHTNVISTDPITGKIIKFNYGEVTSTKAGTGEQALIQNTSMSDHGLTYRVHDADGRPVTKVTSELGGILKEVSGGERKLFSDSNFSLTKVGVKFGDVDGNLFAGKTSTGDRIYGMAVFAKVENELSTISGGISASSVEGDRRTVKFDQQNLYVHLAAELRTPAINMGNLSINGFANTSAEGLVYNMKQISNSSNYTKSATRETDGMIEGNLGLNGSLVLTPNTVLTNKTYATFYPDQANVANASNVIAVKDKVVIQNGIQHTTPENQVIFLETAVILRNYGNSMGVNAQYEDKSSQIKVGAKLESPLSQETPSFLEGSSRKLAFNIEKKTSNGITFSLEFNRDMSKKENLIFFKAGKKF